MKTYREIVREMINEKIELKKEEKLDFLKKDKDYDDFYERYKSYFFEFMVFSKLGTSEFEIPNNSDVEEKITSFIESLSDADLRIVTLIDTEVIDVLVQEIVDSDDFIFFYIVNVELEKDADKYIAEGIFNEREQILIDYLEKTKASGLDSFLVETIFDESALCHNKITCSGMVESVEEWLFVSDVEQIRRVSHNGRVIYERDLL